MAFLERLKLRRAAAAPNEGEPAGGRAPDAPPIAPKLKTRLTELGQLLFPRRGARRLAPSAPIDSGPPDPARILFADGGAAPDGRAGQYREIAEQLMRDARDLDTVEARNADILGRKIAAGLVELAAAKATGAMTFMVQIVLGVGFAGLFVGLVYRIVNQAPYGPFGFATLYFLLGLLAAAFLLFVTDAAARSARARLMKTEDNLAALIEETTSGFHETLVRLRAGMAADGPGDLPKAIAAASQARLVTVSALRFFDRAPVVGAETGERCEVLIGMLRDSAGSGLKAALAGFFVFFGAIAAFAAGAAAVYMSAAEPPPLGAIGEIVSRLKTLEAAAPGRVVLALAIAGAIVAPVILGPLVALARASAAPRDFLASPPARPLVAGMHARARAGAAERRDELIERYADALVSLERRADGWAARGGRMAAGPEETPAWRRPPEGPRFVDSGFQAAPRTFLVGPQEAGKDARGRRPKKFF